MQNKKIWITCILLTGIFIILIKVIHFVSNDYSYSKNVGRFTKTLTNAMTVTYNSKTCEGFCASIDFELEEGKVDWEIVNPENIIVYKGYVIFEGGKVFRGLTYSAYPDEYSNPNDREEVKYEKDSFGNMIPDFRYLQFDRPSIPGDYKLILKPTKAKGSYKILWSKRLPTK